MASARDILVKLDICDDLNTKSVSFNRLSGCRRRGENVNFPKQFN